MPHSYCDSIVTVEDAEALIKDYCGEFAADYDAVGVACDLESMGDGDIERIGPDLWTAILNINDTTSHVYKIVAQSPRMCVGYIHNERRYLLLEDARPSESPNSESPEFEARALNEDGDIVTLRWYKVADEDAYQQAVESDDWSHVFDWSRADYVGPVCGTLA